MKTAGILSRTFAVFFFLSLPTFSAHAQKARAMANISITCRSALNICYSYEEGDKTINVAGDVVTVIIDGNHSISCNPAAGGIPVRNLFLHEPGNASIGKGYVGVEACANPAEGTAVMNVFEDSQVYETFSAWQEALSGGIVY